MCCGERPSNGWRKIIGQNDKKVRGSGADLTNVQFSMFNCHPRELQSCGWRQIPFVCVSTALSASIAGT
jgi:hypothetical protein